MAHHEPCGPHEIFVGNTQRENGNLRFLTHLKTARLGGVAYCIEGKRLPATYAPLFIARSEEAAYDATMMARAFGPNWRRG
jgi:hypothetical protein